MFLMGTGDRSKASGLVGLKFFVRGKPWVVSIDTKLPFNGN